MVVDTLLTVLVAIASQFEPQARLLTEPVGFRGWTAAQLSPGCVSNTAGTLLVRPCAGWLRTDVPVFGDFTITFAVRAPLADTRALLGLLGVNDPSGAPGLLAAVPVLGAVDVPKPSKPRINMLPISASGRAQAMKADGEWQSYSVTRNRDGIHVLLNGTQILASGPVEASDGWIGFHAEAGAFELRDLRIRPSIIAVPGLLATGSGPGPGGARVAGVLVDGAYRQGNGVSPPKLVQDVRPAYTAQAIAAKIQGHVVIECVVEADGSVARARVMRSLDTRFGLDDEAIKAARGWRFQPGTRNGTPVPVWITIELTFALGR